MNHELTRILLNILLAGMAATGFAAISNPPRKALPVCALLAAIGHTFRFVLIDHGGWGIVEGSLAAAFLIGLLSMLFAKRIHCPAEIFAFPSLLPMIPGMYAYNTFLGLMRFMKDGNVPVREELMLEIVHNGLTAVFTLAVLVVGVSLPLFIFHKQSFRMTRLVAPFRKK